MVPYLYPYLIVTLFKELEDTPASGWGWEAAMALVLGIVGLTLDYRPVDSAPA